MFFYMIQVSSTICGLQFPQSVDLHFRFLKSTFSKEKKTLKSKELQKLVLLLFHSECLELEMVQCARTLALPVCRTEFKSPAVTE